MRIHSFDHNSWCQALAGLGTLKQRRSGLYSEAIGNNAARHGVAKALQTCNRSLQKRAVGPAGESGQASQRRHSPSWVLRDEYEFAGLEWGKGTPGRGTRECGRHGHGIFREQWGLWQGVG